MKLLRSILLIAFSILHFPFFIPAGQAQDRPYGKPFATRMVVMAQNGMACTSHPLSTQAAIEVLKKWG